MPTTLPDPSLSLVEVARAVKRMRLVERVLMLAAVLTMLAAMWWTDRRFDGRHGPVIIAVIVTVGAWSIFLTVFVPFRCPRCGHRLWSSGRFSRGSLDRSSCEKCGVSFLGHDKVQRSADLKR